MEAHCPCACSQQFMIEAAERGISKLGIETTTPMGSLAPCWELKAAEPLEDLE